MKTFCLLTCLTACLFFCHLSFAQKKLFTGYYLTLQNDTVRGRFPGYSQWNKNPGEVEFVTEGSGATMRLTPQNTHRFVVHDYDEYATYKGRRLLNPVDDYVLMNETGFVTDADSSQEVQAFLRLVTRTTAGVLYLLNDGKRANFFYQPLGQPITELRYKKVIYQGQVREIAAFRQQLHALFAEPIEAKGLFRRLELLPYTEDALSGFLQSLFPATGQKSWRQRQPTVLVIGAGASLNRVGIKAAKSFTAVPRKYGSDFSPLLSAGLIVPISRNFGRYFFQPQLTLFRYRNTGEETQGTLINSVTFRSDFAAMLQVNGGLYVVNREGRRVFVSAGVGMMGQVGARQVRQRYSPDRTPYADATTIKLPALTYAVEASAGAELNKQIRVSAAYLLPANIGNFMFYMPQLSSFRLSLGYMLNR